MISAILLVLTLLIVAVCLNYTILRISQTVNNNSLFSILNIFTTFGSVVGLLLQIVLMSFYFKFSIEVLGAEEIVFAEVLLPVIFSMVIVLANMVVSFIKLNNIYHVVLNKSHVEIADISYLLRPENLWKLNIRKNIASFIQFTFLSLYFKRKGYFSFLKALIIIAIGMFFVVMFPVFLKGLFPV